MSASYTVFFGSIITPTSLDSYDALPHALLAIEKATGIIKFVEKDVNVYKVEEILQVIENRYGIKKDDVDVCVLNDGEFLIPGFVDTHTHAPQVPNIGSGQQHELLDWLSEVTFPMEARFKDVTFARKAYTSVVRRIIDCGTTTCCYYGTLHLEATKVLAEIVHQMGQRAFVGKCNMDRHSPDYYVEPSPERSLEDTKELISYIRSLTPPPPTSSPTYGEGESLVKPILTPRFAISCSPELLASLGNLASEDPTLNIQTHISENESEIVFTKSLFPNEVLEKFGINHHHHNHLDFNSTHKHNHKHDTKTKHTTTTYAGVYDAFGLLRENTILAHAVHLEEEEIEIVKRTGAGISHCPTSNFNLRSGFTKVGMLLDKGIKVGLGTDVSGGFSPSILTAIQHASICSKVVSLSSPPSSSSPTTPTSSPTSSSYTSRQLSVPTLFYLSTLGGASLCNLTSQIGSLTPGKQFDALLISLRSNSGNPSIWGWDLDLEVGVRGSGGESGEEGGRGKGEKEELEGLLERFLFCGDDRNVRRVWVAGRLVGGKDFGI
ncbi:guanine deaminase [Abortiporus biennis]|nr:guanine deaminase [Abortiporus biennis]